MRTFTQTEQDLLVHLLKGGKVATNVIGDGATTLTGLSLDDGVDLSLDLLLEDYQMHFNAEELRIKELEALLETQGAALQKALAKNVELDPPKPRRAHITRQDVIAVEQDIEAGGDSSLIQSTHNLSLSTYSRILNHTHKHSTIIVEEM